MERNIVLRISPWDSGIEVVDDLVLKVTAPYSDQSATLKVNPNVTSYQEQPSANVRQMMTFEDMTETQTLNFNLGRAAEQQLVSGGRSYRIRLLRVGKVQLEGQAFPEFGFHVSGGEVDEDVKGNQAGN